MNTESNFDDGETKRDHVEDSECDEKLGWDDARKE